MARQTITGVTQDGLNDYNPELYDAHLQADGTFTLVPVLWHDDASYAAYQGDPYQGD